MCVFANISIYIVRFRCGRNTFGLINPLLDAGGGDDDNMLGCVIDVTAAIGCIIGGGGVINVVVYVGIFWFIGGRCVCVWSKANPF